MTSYDDKYLQYLCLEDMCKGHRKFAPPQWPTRPTATSMRRELARAGGQQLNTGFRSHPILGMLPCYDGVDDDESGMPSRSEHAYALYYTLQLKLGLQPKFNPMPPPPA